MRRGRASRTTCCVKPRKAGQKLNIFTGRVLSEDDPVYRGVLLPLSWKIAVFIKRDQTLSVSAYLLYQTELIEQEIGLERFDPATYQVAVQELVERTGIDFSYFADDEAPLERAEGLERAADFVRKPLGSVADIVL